MMRCLRYLRSSTPFFWCRLGQVNTCQSVYTYPRSGLQWSCTIWYRAPSMTANSALTIYGSKFKFATLDCICTHAQISMSSCRFSARTLQFPVTGITDTSAMRCISNETVLYFSGCLFKLKSECKTAKDHVTWIHQQKLRWHVMTWILLVDSSYVISCTFAFQVWLE